MHRSAGSQIVDAVCPLVSKVHAEARRYAGRGHKIALVGHAGHVEVEGTMGEAPDSIVLVETPEDVGGARARGRPAAGLPDADDALARRHGRRRRRAPRARPRSRRAALGGHLLRDAEPPGRRQAHLRARPRSSSSSARKTSSNANRLVEVAHSKGADAYLIDDETDLELDWLEGHETVGLTAGASSPEVLVERVVDRLAELGYAEREDVEIAREDVFFRLPASLR